MINTCLFPVAGYGTRFLPATKAVPKEMLPVLDKPLVQYGVEEAVDAGFSQMGFVTGRGKRAIEDHFDRSPEVENQIEGTSKADLLAGVSKLIDTCSFSFTRQVEMGGLGDAILKGRPLVGNEPFAVVLPDDLCFCEEAGVLQQMVALHEHFGCSIVAIEEVPEDQIHNYGVISGEPIDAPGEDMAGRLFRVNGMVEKPQSDPPSNLAIIGRYILTPDIFGIIENTEPGANGELQITDALRTQAEQGSVIGYRFKGRRFDCGSVPGFVEATNYCFEQRFGKAYGPTTSVEGHTGA